MGQQLVTDIEKV